MPPRIQRNRRHACIVGIVGLVATGGSTGALTNVVEVSFPSHRIAVCAEVCSHSHICWGFRHACAVTRRQLRCSEA